jgi:hypothetical protein
LIDALFERFGWHLEAEQSDTKLFGQGGDAILPRAHPLAAIIDEGAAVSVRPPTRFCASRTSTLAPAAAGNRAAQRFRYVRRMRPSAFVVFILITT